MAWYGAAGSKVVLAGRAQLATGAAEAAAVFCDRQRQGAHQGASQPDPPFYDKQGGAAQRPAAHSTYLLRSSTAA